MLAGDGDDQYTRTRISPDSTRLALAESGLASVYEMSTGELTSFYHMHGGNWDPQWGPQSETVGYVHNGKYVVQDIITSDTTSFWLVHGVGNYQQQARDLTGHRIALSLDLDQRFLLISPHRETSKIVSFTADSWIWGLYWRP